MNKTLEEIKKEFEELLKRILENHAFSIDGRMIWNVNDDDDPDDGWVYADETIWSFIESTISQTKQELEVKEYVRGEKTGYEKGMVVGKRIGKREGIKIGKQELIEEIKDKLVFTKERVFWKADQKIKGLSLREMYDAKTIDEILEKLSNK